MKRKHIEIKGIVQGVGFRPFVFRLAQDLHLTGFVRNTSNGVDIEIQGPTVRLNDFIVRLRKEKPKAAYIDSQSVRNITPFHEKQFLIKKSKRARGFTHISPDIATCQECLTEFSQPTDRRYRYPFINCTNCGPRYSIIRNTPYDREETAMSGFRMCSECTREFTDVYDRRFHAQPDCCRVCGPEFSFSTIRGKKIRIGRPIERAAAIIKRGGIIAVKGIGGYHIACDAGNDSAVIALRKRKNRPTKPFAIMSKLEHLSQVVSISRKEREFFESACAPIMLLKKKGMKLSEYIAPGNPYLGVMHPYTPVHYLLLEHVPFLVMTSANIQDEPIATDEWTVQKKLRKLVSHSLTHNRAIENRCDDSVGFFTPRYGFSIIRRSRGYVPAPLELPITVRPTLAVGPFLKNTFTLARKKVAYISPHIGDLDNLETLTFFKDMVAKYRRWFRIDPEYVAHDLHPDYLSTQVALSMPGKKVPVQHHIAHFISCLGEHNVTDKAIGITFDGTGFGHDGTVWGGEFFVGDLFSQERIAHLGYLPLPGGEASIRKPYRIAIAYVYSLLNQALDVAGVSGDERDRIIRMTQKRGSHVLTSSMGRLFDAVSALLGITLQVTFEAEAAINLENIAKSNIRTYYPYTIDGERPLIINVTKMIAALLNDRKKGVSLGTISAKFHNTIVMFSLDIVKKLSMMYRVKKVCLSGGVFQNRFLFERLSAVLENNGFAVYVHRKLPTNDGCISFGQVIAANAKSRQ